MSASEIKVACKRCLKPGSPRAIFHSGIDHDDHELVHPEAGELCKCGGELVTIPHLLVLMSERFTMLATHMADMLSKMAELEDKENDILLQQIGHMVGSDNGMNVLDGVNRFVARAKELADGIDQFGMPGPLLDVMAKNLINLIPKD